MMKFKLYHILFYALCQNEDITGCGCASRALILVSNAARVQYRGCAEVVWPLTTGLPKVCDNNGMGMGRVSVWMWCGIYVQKWGGIG